jgi:hypothetical protein
MEKYPEGGIQTSGCKVGWISYTSEELAKEASRIAKINADIMWNNGYDFGYCSPGAIDKTEDSWIVTIP